jgi:hypothetical protein
MFGAQVLLDYRKEAPILRNSVTETGHVAVAAEAVCPGGVEVRRNRERERERRLEKRGREQKRYGGHA